MVSFNLRASLTYPPTIPSEPRAYRQTSLLVHPDKCRNPEKVDRYELAFKLLSSVYAEFPPGLSWSPRG